MRVVLWIVLVAWIAAFFRTILNLLAVKRLPADAPDDGPTVSVVVPARNEEQSIERTVRAFLAQSYGHLELIVVDDRSSDATGAILDRLAAADKRLAVIHGEEPPGGWLGKPWALHQGSRGATGEVLLFADADIFYEPDAVRRAVAALRAVGVPMISLLPHFVMKGFWENVLIPQLAVFFFAVIPAWLANRTRTVWLGVGGGTGNMIDRTFYESIGGHEALRDAVVDDVALARLVRRNGRGTIVFRADDCVSVRIYRGFRETVNGFTKNAFAVAGRSFLLAMAVVLGVIVIHVLPYAVAVTGEPISLATVAIITLTRLLLFRSLRYPLLYALFAHPLMVSVWAYILLRSMWFTGVRGELRWRGRSYDAAQTQFGGDIRARL